MSLFRMPMTLGPVALLASAGGIGTAHAEPVFGGFSAPKLQQKCVAFSATMKNITGSFSYKNWEGDPITKTFTLNPGPSGCITDSQNWYMNFKKEKDQFPTFSIDLRLRTSNGIDVTMDAATLFKTNCVEVMEKWAVDAYSVWNPTPEQSNRIRANMRNAFCPAFKNAVAAAVAARLPR